MPKLEPPDAFALSAALGWLELGNAAEALAELEQITAGNQKHSGVLEVRWAALAELKQWEPALATACDLIQAAPENPSAWLHRAYALRRVPHGGLAAAREALRPAAEKFLQEPVIAFNLACYACQMGDLPEARQWLQRATAAGDAREIRQMALADADLAALWPEIHSSSADA
jgi:Flp pilus assembly protein TadD